MSELTEKKMKDLDDLISTLEKVVKKTFNHSTMNYLMLMMVDHHVHFHVIPRYESERKFEELTWVDNGWPALPVLGDNQHNNNSEMLQNIKKVYQSNL